MIMNLEKCYEFLELQSEFKENEPKSTKDLQIQQIHQAYRKLILRYHPDKNRHQPEEQQEKAKKKFIQIYQAYHYLKLNFDHDHEKMKMAPKFDLKTAKTNKTKQKFQKTIPNNASIIEELPLSFSQILTGCIVKKKIKRTITIIVDNDNDDSHPSSTFRRIRNNMITLDVCIPPGVQPGTKIRLRECGNQTILKSEINKKTKINNKFQTQLPGGDVIFIICDKPNKTFQRFGTSPNSVHLEHHLMISLHKYLYGGVVEIPTLERPSEISPQEWRYVSSKIIQKQGYIRLIGRGLPYPQSAVDHDPKQESKEFLKTNIRQQKRGDLIVRFKLYDTIIIVNILIKFLNIFLRKVI